MNERRPGQPTKYRQEYCQMLIEHRKQGYSFESFAAVVDVDQDTLYEWAKVHKEFSEAKKKAKAQSLYAYEKIGLAIMGGKIQGANIAAWIFMLKNQHADRYLEKPVLEEDVVEGIEFVYEEEEK